MTPQARYPLAPPAQAESQAKKFAEALQRLGDKHILAKKVERKDAPRYA